MYFTVITEQEKLFPFYIKGIGVQENQEPIDRPEGFLDYQWIYCSQGSGQLYIDKQVFSIEAGQGFYMIPNIPHRYISTQEPWVTHWITFNGSILDLLFHQLGLGRFGIFLRSQDMSFFDCLYKRLSADNLDKIVNTSKDLYTLFIDTKNDLQRNSLSKVVSQEDPLTPVIHYMAKHFSEDISLDQLALTIKVTDSYLCKLFKKRTGMTPIQYLIRLRLQESKRLLLHSSELKIYEIARHIGYNDTSYFCHIFKKQEHMSPKEFRILHGINRLT